MNAAAQRDPNESMADIVGRIIRDKGIAVPEPAEDALPHFSTRQPRGKDGTFNGPPR